MRGARGWFARLFTPIVRIRTERDIDFELRSHLELHTDDNIRAGMSPDTARRQAWIALGGLERMKDEYRDQRGFPMLGSLTRDVRYAVRLLSMVVLAVGLLACLVPAYRATRVDPLQALRAE